MKNPLIIFAVAGLLSILPCSLTRADEYILPAGGGDLIGRVETLQITTEETLADVARNEDLGYEEIRLANPDVDFWLPGTGTRVILPKRHILPRAQREGIVLNVPEMRLYYFPEPCVPKQDCRVITYPVSIGRQDWKTPLGTARVTSKVKDPTWRPPESIRAEAAADGRHLPAVVPPGPDNPMGAYALYLDLPGYRIHGTNRPYGVGMRATHGCVRLYPEDIRTLFEDVPVGIKVQIVSQPVKFGWEGDELFMEVSPPLEEDVESAAHMEDLAFDQLAEIALERPFMLVNKEFQQAIDQPSGMPLVVSSWVEAKKTGPSVDGPALSLP